MDKIDAKMQGMVGPDTIELYYESESHRAQNGDYLINLGAVDRFVYELAQGLSYQGYQTNQARDLLKAVFAASADRAVSRTLDEWLETRKAEREAQKTLSAAGWKRVDITTE